MPLPWNSKEVCGRTVSVQSTPEIKTPTKVPQQVQSVKKDIVEKQIEALPVKNNILDMSSNSNISSQVTSTSVIHSAEQSFGKFYI